ncbi:MAG: PilZ domain-containing protein [Planctomycetales bacterium]|nr:PilZ domain-containing protein [Planctomycetales bacterium]
MEAEVADVGLGKRSFSRVGMRTMVTTITQPQGGAPQVLKAWTDDISASGCRLLSRQAIATAEIRLRIILPGLAERFFCGRITRRGIEHNPSIGKLGADVYVYGVEFVGVCSPQEAAELQALSEGKTADKR